MECIHIKNLEKHHPGYRDRVLRWAKFYFNMVQGDPDFEMINNEIDKWRFVALCMLELQAKKPIPLDDGYLIRKGFNLKKRPISLTIQMLHNFVEVVTLGSEIAPHRVEESREEESREEKSRYIEFVQLTKREYDKLIEIFGKKTTEEYIQRLNNYIGSKGKRYKSHYHTILTWADKDKAKPTEAQKRTKESLDRLNQMEVVTADENRPKLSGND